MDGFQYALMIDRLKAKGRTDYTDGDIVNEFVIYQKELTIDDGQTPAGDEAALQDTLPTNPLPAE